MTGRTCGKLYVDGQLLCDTIEPDDRGLVNRSMVGKTDSEEWVKAKLDTLYAKYRNGKGNVAIPTGHYKATVEISSQLNKRRLFLWDVPGFGMVMVNDTKAGTNGQYILIGDMTPDFRLTMSQHYLKVIIDRAEEAMRNREMIVVRLKD